MQLDLLIVLFLACHILAMSTSNKRQLGLAGFLVSIEKTKKPRIEQVRRDPALRKAESADPNRLGIEEGTVITKESKINISDEEKEDQEEESFQIIGDSIPKIDPYINYPPANHASYRPPPCPDYNHPITITSPPPALISALKFNTIPKIINSPADLDLLFFHRFIDPSVARKLTKYLLDEMPWYRVNYKTRGGMDIKTPRYTTVFGKDATHLPWDQYLKWKPRAIPEILLRLMQKGQPILHRVGGKLISQSRKLQAKHTILH